MEVKNLTKKFNKKCVLNNISFKTENQIIGLLGPNGAGKTTLLRILAGLIRKSEGEVKYSHMDRGSVSIKDCQIGYLPQNFGMIKSYTLYEHMEYFACLKNIPKTEWKQEISKSLEAVHLTSMMNTKCKKLSGGMVRRAGIAQAIMGKPDLILFDEPTTGLDPEERLRFQNMVFGLKGKCTIIISTHIIDDITKVCDETFVLNEGTLQYKGKTKMLAHLAQGRVYAMAERESMHWQEYGMNVKNYCSESGENMVHFLYLKESEYQNPKAVLVDAQVEDGYLFLLKYHEKVEPQ